MNERIQQLADEAKRYALETYPSPYEPYANLYDKKFAELITLDSMSLLKTMMLAYPADEFEYGYNKALETSIGVLEKLYGVKNERTN